MPLTVDGGNGLPKQMDEDSEFDDIELDGIALTAFTGGQATTSGNFYQVEAHDEPWVGALPWHALNAQVVFQSAACRSD